MRNKCLLGLGLVFVISLTSMVAFAFSFTGTPADEVDETEMIVRAVVSEEADANANNGTNHNNWTRTGNGKK